MTNKPSNETHQLDTGLSTLVVRLELDWEKLGEALARFSTRHDSLVAQPGILRGAAAADAMHAAVRKFSGSPMAASQMGRAIIEFLAGTLAPEVYPADTERATDGRVVSTTTQAVVDGCAIPGLTKERVGMLLTQLRWHKGYMTGSRGIRERRYFAPSAWLQS